MSRYHELLKKAYKEILTEQEQPPVPTNVQPEQPELTKANQIPEQPPEPNKIEEPKNPLTSEGEAFLVRLLAKSLMIEITDPSDEMAIKDLGTINPNNATEALKALIPIIQKYSPSVEELPEA